MSKIFKMHSVPILNVTDFYKWFDILDVMRNREDCVHFALGHFKWSNSINLHHIDVLKKCCKSGTAVSMADPSEYWYSDEKGLCKNPCDALAGYETQKRIVDKIYERYDKDFLDQDQDRAILMILIAAVLLANQTETCLNHISAEELKSAYLRQSKQHAQPLPNVIHLSLKDSSLKLVLPFFLGSFRLPFNQNLKASSENRFQTWVIQSTSNATLEFFDVCSSNVIDKRALKPNERLFCLVLNETVVKILPSIVKNGQNTLAREKDGIYLNDQKHAAIPLEASSFAVGMDESAPWLVYVCDGYIRFVNSDGIGFKRKVSEQINVIAEVCVVNEKAVIVRDDGMVWDGDCFIQGGAENEE